MLHNIYDRHKLLADKLYLLPSNQRLLALQSVDTYHISVFEYASSHRKSIDAIAQQITSDEFFKLCTQPNWKGFTTLNLSTKKMKCFFALLKHIAKERRLEALMQVDMLNQTLLNYLAQLKQVNLLEVLFLLPSQHLLTAFQSILFFVKDAKQLKYIFDTLQSDECLLAANTVGPSGWSLLQYHAFYHPELFEIVWDALEKSVLPSALALTDTDQRNCLHIALFNPRVVAAIIQRVANKSLFALIEMQNSLGNTVLHIAARLNSLSFKKFMDLYPQEEKLGALLRLNHKNESVFYYSIYLLDSFNTSIQFIPQQDRFALLTYSQKKMPSMLHLAASVSLDIFQAAYLSITKEQQPHALKIVDHDGNTLFHAATRFSKCFEYLLDLLPVAEQDIELSKSNHAGETVLFNAGFYPDSLSLALNIVSKPVVALQKTNFESTSPLQIAAFDPDSLHQALSLIALENRPALIFRPNLEGKTLLQFASYRKATLLVLLALAPKDVKGVLCLLLTLFKIANNNQPQRIMPHRFFEYDNNDNRLLANTMFDRLIEQPNFEAMKIESEAFLQMHPESSFILS